MRKVILMAFAAMLTIGANAQENESAKTKSEAKNWNVAYVQYSPGSLSISGGGSESFNSFSAGWNTGIRLSRSLPIYFETGLGVQYSYYSESGMLEAFDDVYNGKVTVNMLSAKVPLGVSYAFDIPDAPISIIPTLGLDFRFNIFGQAEVKASSRDGSFSKTLDLFSSDDMGSSSNTLDRFQVGGHVGLNFRLWNKVLVGYAYQFDFMEIANNITITQHNITLGYCF